MPRSEMIVLRISLLLWAAVPLSAAEPPGVVAKCARALGGEENWRQIRTLEMRGTETSLGLSRPFLIRRKRPDLYRVESQAQGDRSIEAHDGSMSWVQMDMTVGFKGHWPAPAPSFVGVWLEVDAEFAPPCIELRERGHGPKELGEADCDGVPCYGIELTLRNGQVETWYVDRETFLPILRTRVKPYAGHLAEERVFYDDYREVSGVMLAHYTEQEFGNLYRVREFESVDVDVDIADSEFALPPPAGMEKLRPLAGRFNVKVESFMPGLPALETETLSEIRTDFHHAALTEEASLVVFPGLHLRVRRLFTYDRFRDVFRIAYLDDSTAHLDILEGAFEQDRLVVSNLSTETGWKFFDQPRHARQSFYEISSVGFKLDVELSTDGGETWSLERRLTYTRAMGP